MSLRMPGSPYWITNPKWVSLSDEALDVWKVGLDNETREVNSEELSVLSIDERQRAAQFRSLEDRRRFVACHLALREILARYLKAQPADIRYAIGANGKPALDESSPLRDLSFNLSHSDEIALVAVTRTIPVGVDVERVQYLPDAGQISARFFTASERARLQELSLPERRESFLRVWTHKEAVLKAEGYGLSESLDRVEVSVEREGSYSILSIGGDRVDGARWFVQEVFPEPGYIGCVAAKRHGLRINYYRYGSSMDQYCSHSHS